MSGSLCKGCVNAQNGGCRSAKAGKAMFPAPVLRGDPRQPAQSKA